MTENRTMPEGRPAMTPYLIVNDYPAALAFYQSAFGAAEDFRLSEPSGKVGHAELKILGATVMMAEEYPDFGAVSAQSVGGCPITLHVYVADVDAVVARAEQAGATVMRKVRDEFFGHRTGTLVDPFGYKWTIATQIEDVSPEEMQSRWNDALDEHVP